MIRDLPTGSSVVEMNLIAVRSTTRHVSDELHFVTSRYVK